MTNSLVIPAGNGGVSHYFKYRGELHLMKDLERSLFFSTKMKNSFNPLIILPSLTFLSQITSGNGFLAVCYPDSSHFIWPLKFCCTFLPGLPARPITAQFKGFETV